MSDQPLLFALPEPAAPPTVGNAPPPPTSRWVEACERTRVGPAAVAVVRRDLRLFVLCDNWGTIHVQDHPAFVAGGLYRVDLELGDEDRAPVLVPAPGAQVVARCRRCANAARANTLQGEHHAGVPCDSRCWNATGHTCKCSCGGRAHGQNTRR